MHSPVTQIKERLTIADVIGGYIKLEKAGIHFKARCPFHNEKTPSFFVSSDRGSYHCFGCGRGGDIFTFVQEIEGVTFAEALKILATRAGVTLEKIDQKATDEFAGIYHALEEATRYYEMSLKESQAVITYLKQRGLTGETAKKFRIGYAPDGWRNLIDHLQRMKVPLSFAEKAGLIVKNEKTQTNGAPYYDRFRGRIMFPICAPNGKVVAFSGRIFPEPEDKSIAKYINSPETVLYNKSRILFGYDKAKQALLRENACIVVEGQMDLCMAHQAKTLHSVAVSGTALTIDHLKLIKRFTDKLILCFDSDKAGVSAAKRSVHNALVLGMDVLAISLDGGKDPAEIIQKNEASWHTAVAQAVPFIEFLVHAIMKEIKDPRALKKEIAKEVIPLVKSIPSAIDRAHFISYIARQIGVPEAAVYEEVGTTQSASLQKNEESLTREYGISENQSTKENVRMRLLGGYLWKPDESISTLYKKITGHSIDEDSASLEQSKKDSLILEAEIRHQTKDHWLVDARELLVTLEEEYLDKDFEKLLREIKQAEIDKDAERGLQLLKESQKISKRKDELKMSRIKQ